MNYSGLFGYNKYFFSLTLILFILVFLFSLIDKFSSDKISDSIKNDTPFECGVSSDHSTRISFSLPFYLTSIVFLMFDIEIIILFPILYSTWVFSVWMWIIMLILLVGLWVEWSFGSLNWKV